VPPRLRVAGNLFAAPRHLHQLVVEVVLVRDLAPRAVRHLGHPPPQVVRNRQPLARAVVNLDELAPRVREPMGVAIAVGLGDQPSLGIEPIRGPGVFLNFSPTPPSPPASTSRFSADAIRSCIRCQVFPRGTGASAIRFSPAMMLARQAYIPKNEISAVVKQR